MIITYQDFLKVGTQDAAKIEFCYNAIQRHKQTSDYSTALAANLYDKKQNPTIKQYMRLIYTVTGDKAPDPTGSGFKLISADFPFLVEQRVQYLLSNGATFAEESTQERLGDDFDYKLQDAAHFALVEKVAFGFWNLDHLDVFRYTEFVPLFDEENGSLRAGIRFWQLDSDKPLRAVLYEEDGYTGYIWKDGNGEVRTEKRAYINHMIKPSEDEDVIYTGENYPTFPIVPLWGNKHHQSELIGIQEKIDCYDLIESGFANTVEEASYIYWAIQGAPAMDDEDLLNFVDKMKKLHAAVVEDNGARAEAHSVEAPSTAREAVLTRLKNDIYADFGGFDPQNLASGAATATEIKAAYERLNQKANGLEYCVLEFVKSVLGVAGMEDEVTFTRNAVINTAEEVQTVVQAAQYLDSEYVTRKILTILGDGDQAEDVLKRMDEDELERGGLLMQGGAEKFGGQEQEEPEQEQETEDFGKDREEKKRGKSYRGAAVSNRRGLAQMQATGT